MLIDTSSKIISLMSAPRSCSTTLSKIIFQYFKRVYGFNQLLNEPFFENHIQRTSDGILAAKVSKRTTDLGFYVKRYSLVGDDKLVELIDLKRSGSVDHAALVEMMQKCKNKIMPHCQLHNLKPTSEDFLFSYPVIFIERRDKLDQILSFGLAAKSNIFHIFDTSNTPQIPEHSITMPTTEVIFMIEAISKLKNFQRRFPKYPTIYYEDFDFMNAVEYIEKKLSLPESGIPPQLVVRNIAARFNYGDKSRYFKNIDDIRKTLENSSHRFK